MKDWSISNEASALHQDALIWDCHSCLPLSPDIDLGVLTRHKKAGVDFVSINVGMDMNPLADVMRVLAAFRAWLRGHRDGYVLAGSVADVRQAKKDGKLAVAFDLEGSVPLTGQAEMVHLFHDLGVRQIHLAYNRNNDAGGGCHDEDIGLTEFGHRVVAAINEAGMLMDCSHTGHRTSLDIMAASAKPVIFSHSNARALVDHQRNITDEQIDACVKTGGVIGVNGVGRFLGDEQAGTEAVLRHLDYLVERAGPDHVGLGIDYSYDMGVPSMPADTDRTYWWPKNAGYGGGAMKIAAPEQFPGITEGLLAHGHGEAEVRAILGGNFLRVAEATWG